MLETIILYINSRIQSLNLFAKLHSLCEQIKETDTDNNTLLYPAQYCSKDEHKQIDFDFKNGLIYHRLTGAVTRTEAEGQIGACDMQITQVYPMRTVAVCKKNVLKTDDNFIDGKIAENIINAITQRNNSVLVQTLKADLVSIKINSFTTDRNVIIADEYQGTDFQVKYDHVYLAIDYEISITGSVGCFDFWGCNNAASDVVFCKAKSFTITQLTDPQNGLSQSQMEQLIPYISCAAIQSGLTQEQTDCLIAALCESCPTITEIEGGSTPSPVFAPINGLLDACVP